MKIRALKKLKRIKPTLSLLDWAIGRMLTPILRWRDFVGKVPYKFYVLDKLPLSYESDRGSFARRSMFIAGAAAFGIAAGVTPAAADQNFTSFAFNSTGGTTPRTDPDRWADVINVRDYAAIPDGRDNTIPLQNAFNAAFGAYNGTPHGDTNRFLNKPVFIPAGNYRTTGPLYIYGAQGGWIYGNGAESTTISFENPGTGTVTIPRTTVSGAANNGSGRIRLTVTSTSGWSTSDQKVVGAVGGVPAANGSWLITVIDGTHVDLQGSTFAGSYTSGGFVGDLGAEFTPAIMLNGCAYTKFEGFTIGSNDHGTLTEPTTGVYSYTNGSWFCSANEFHNLLLNGETVGILGGYGGSGGNCDNHVVYLCQFNNCAYAGVRIVNQNALNWQIIGGGAGQCAWMSTGPGGNGGAAYSCAVGGLSPISGVSVSGNTWDVIGQGFAPVTMIGGSSESINGIGVNGVQANAQGVCFRNAESLQTFQVTGSVTNSILTVTAITPGNKVVVPGATISGTGITGGTKITTQLTAASAAGVGFQVGTYQLDTSSSATGPITITGSCPTVAVDASAAGSYAVLNSCFFNPGTNNGAGFILKLGSSGVGIIDSLWDGSNACLISGTTGSKLSIRGLNSYIGNTPLTGFTGTILSDNSLQNIAVGSLPTAAAKYAGCSGSVTDSSVTTFNSNVANGGTNRVPVFCGSADGVTYNWKVG